MGVAAPALCLTAHLDPVGHPLSLWADAAVTGYLSAHRSMAPGRSAAHEPAEVTAEQARSVVQLLHHYSLINVDSRDGNCAVRMHELTARAARENAPSALISAVVPAAADALAAGIPDPDTAEHLVITGPGQKDIAAALQLAVSTTENALRTLRHHGVLEARYRQFVVRDVDSLRHFVGT